MATKGDARTRKSALRIVGILGVLVLLCCTGGAYFAWGLSDGLSTRLIVMDERIGAEFPEGTVWRLERTLTPGSEAALSSVLVVGFAEPVPPAEHDETVDRVWRLYCDAFAEGGLEIGELALGRTPGPSEESGGGSPDENFAHAGSVVDWQSSRYPVSEAVERTGIPVPREMGLMEWFDDAPDDGGGEDEQR